MLLINTAQPVEYCSYKGLTPYGISGLRTLAIVEYCSYKGLTQL